MARYLSGLHLECIMSLVFVNSVKGVLDGLNGGEATSQNPSLNIY